jgi:hypothetical protein
VRSWCIDPHILNLGSRWRCSWAVSFTPPSRFIPVERAPCTHWIGGSLGPTAGMNAVERRSLLPAGSREPILGRPATQPVAIPTDLSRFLEVRNSELNSQRLLSYCIDFYRSATPLSLFCSILWGDDCLSSDSVYFSVGYNLRVSHYHHIWPTVDLNIKPKGKEIFRKPPCCYFTFYKNIVKIDCIFF